MWPLCQEKCHSFYFCLPFELFKALELRKNKNKKVTTVTLLPQLNPAESNVTCNPIFGTKHEYHCCKSLLERCCLKWKSVAVVSPFLCLIHLVKFGLPSWSEKSTFASAVTSGRTAPPQRQVLWTPSKKASSDPSRSPVSPLQLPWTELWKKRHKQQTDVACAFLVTSLEAFPWYLGAAAGGTKVQSCWCSWWGGV